MRRQHSIIPALALSLLLWAAIGYGAWYAYAHWLAGPIWMACGYVDAAPWWAIAVVVIAMVVFARRGKS